MSRTCKTPVGLDLPAGHIFPLTPRSLVVTLSALNIDTAHLTDGLGFTTDDLADPNCRLSAKQSLEMIRRSLRAAPGLALGLETGSRETFTAMGQIGYALITSSTVGEAIALGLSLQRDAGSFIGYEVISHGEEMAIVAANQGYEPDLYRFFVEESFASFLQVARNLVGDKFRVKRVEISYSDPTYSAAYRKMFGCEVAFKQARDAFVFSSAWATESLKTADRPSHVQALRAINALKDDLERRVELVEAAGHLMKQNLQQIENAPEIARKLGISERTLRRRLAEKGLTFQALQDSVRKEQALLFLNTSDLSIEAVGRLVGYDDVHNFRRAFKRWTGTTPTDVRGKKRI
jgi:AraC-like DNA-binding protein